MCGFLSSFFFPGSFVSSHKWAENKALKCLCPLLSDLVSQATLIKMTGRNFFNFHILCIQVNLLFSCLQIMAGFGDWGGVFLGMRGIKGKLEHSSLAEAKRNFLFQVFLMVRELQPPAHSPLPAPGVLSFQIIPNILKNGNSDKSTLMGGLFLTGFFSCIIFPF